MAVFNNQNGNDIFQGLSGEYNQVDYFGSLSEFRIYRNADGSVTVEHPTLGTDILIGIDGFWFNADASWYSIDDAINMTDGEGGTEFRVDQWGNLIGTDGDDRLVDTAELRGLYGGRGDDRLVGREDAYSQGAFDGAASDYTITVAANGNIIFESALSGRDTLSDIDGIWFSGEGRWYAIEDLLPDDTGSSDFTIDAWNNLIGTDGNDRLVDTAELSGLYGGLGDDTLVGRADAYSQGAFNGAAVDYTITQAANGNVVFDHPVWGTDTLTNIDGIWFSGEANWYAIADLINDTPQQDTGTLIDGVITGSNDVDDFITGTNGNDIFYVGRGFDTVEAGGGNDTLRVDGDIIEWTFNLQNDGTLIMSHPTWGENTITGVETLHSLRAGRDYTINEALQLTDQLPEFRLDADNVLNGTNGDDVMIGSTAGTNFYGGLGDDDFTGSSRNYDQINYDGNRSEFTFTQNADGSVTADHPIWGVDTFSDIEGLFFNGTGNGGEFILVADLFG